MARTLNVQDIEINFTAGTIPTSDQSASLPQQLRNGRSYKEPEQEPGSYRATSRSNSRRRNRRDVKTSSVDCIHHIKANKCMYVQQVASVHQTQTHDAVTKLMSAKKPKPASEPAEAPARPVKRGFDARNGLGMYIEYPEKNPEGLVVEYDDDFVVINDKFPKARYLILTILEKSNTLTLPVCISSSSRANRNTTSNTLYTCFPTTLLSWLR